MSMIIIHNFETIFQALSVFLQCTFPVVYITGWKSTVGEDNFRQVWAVVVQTHRSMVNQIKATTGNIYLALICLKWFK